MKYLIVALAFVFLPCLAQEKPRAGFIGHGDCRAYFKADRFIVRPDPPLSVLARMTDAEKEEWRKEALRHFEGLTGAEEDWWARKDHKKYPGLCYIPPDYFKHPLCTSLSLDILCRSPSALPNPSPLPLYYAIYFTERYSFHDELITATKTSTRDVPLEGQATVYDEYGQNVGTATVTGTAEVETSTRYPVEVMVPLPKCTRPTDCGVQGAVGWGNFSHVIRMPRPAMTV